MTVHILDFGCFEGPSNFKGLEGSDVGANTAFVTDVLPFHPTERNTLKLGQGGTNTWWGPDRVGVEGNLLVGKFYFYLDGTWPTTFDVALFKMMTATTPYHFKIDLEINGSDQDFVVSSSGGVKSKTVSDPFTAETWYYCDFKCELDGSAGLLALEVRRAINKSLVVSVDVDAGDAWDIFGGSGFNVYFQGETAQPGTVSSTRIGNYSYGVSDTTFALETFLPHVTGRVGGTSVTAAVSECNHTGATPGDTLDSGTWDDTNDANLKSKAAFIHADDSGAVRIQHPFQDSPINPAATCLAGKWCAAHATVDANPDEPENDRFVLIHGRKTSADVYHVSTTAFDAVVALTSNSVCRDATHNDVPLLSPSLEHAVSGLVNGAGSDKAMSINEMRYYGLYLSPVPIVGKLVNKRTGVRNLLASPLVH